MSCASCGSKISPPLAPPTGKDMVAFIENNGWRYTSSCGCSNNMGHYFNPNYPEHMIAASQQRIEIRKKLDAYAKDYRVLAVAGHVNYQIIYSQHFT